MGSRTIEFYDDGRTWRNTVSNDSVTHSARPDKIAFSRVSQQDSIAYTPSNDKIHYARGTVLERVQRRSAFKKVFVAPPPPPPTDPYFSNVVALLHMDGTDASTVFTDVTGRTWSVASGTPQIDTDQSVFGGSSLYLPTTASSISTAASSAWTWHTQPYTIECRSRVPTAFTNDSRGRPRLIGEGASTPGILNWSFGFNSAGKVTFFYWGGSIVLWSAATAASVGAFHHIAASFDGSVMRLFLDGVLDGTFTYTTAHAPDAGQLLRIGFGDYSPVGHADEIRITKGVARYTANFTPPTNPFPDQ